MRNPRAEELRQIPVPPEQESVGRDGEGLRALPPIVGGQWQER